ncbi:PAS domain S-box-containing protein [Dendrosporobacter quercicolus]|uniref:PAS domain S-box-containing protein n=1 Tax=Dendrosporobacter quercicolus TaxID=146817 RepID=A0A1G9M7P7_9FIRM|nr:PAS domain S-box-containing protein [Dendrosporobacter quercicolus]
MRHLFFISRGGVLLDKLFSMDTAPVRNYLSSQQPEKVVALFEQLLMQYQVQQARFDALLNTVDEAVCMIDESDRVVVWNNLAEHLYGITAREIINKPIDQFFSNLLLTKVMKERRTVHEQQHTPCPDKHVLINARPVKLAGRVIGGVSAEKDITEVVQLNEQLSQTHEQVASLQLELDRVSTQSDSFSAIYGHSTAICEAISIARRVAATSAPVLLRGESGTGKELFAKAIHQASGLQGPFIAINCGAISPNLFESELFGYQPGAFTGADRNGKVGLLEQANGGTVLLDELGDMPREMQVKLLRTLQDKCFYRVGGGKPVAIDVRFIAATHRNLEAMIAQGDFREDLYYRLNVVSIVLPSLRERLDDIPELVHRGIKYYDTFYHKKITKVDPELMAALLQYSWPGNIRELFNVLERLVILADSSLLTLDNLPSTFRQAALAGGEPERRPQEINLVQTTGNIEKEMITVALAEAQFNKAVAAKKLGIPRSTLYYKMHKLGIECQ